MCLGLYSVLTVMVMYAIGLLLDGRAFGLLVDQYAIWTPIRWLTYVNDFWPRFIAFVLGGEKLFGLLVMLMIAFVFGVQFLRGKLPRIYPLLLLNFAVLVVIIRYYQGRVEMGHSRAGVEASHG